MVLLALTSGMLFVLSSRMLLSMSDSIFPVEALCWGRLVSMPSLTKDGMHPVLARCFGSRTVTVFVVPLVGGGATDVVATGSEAVLPSRIGTRGTSSVIDLGLVGAVAVLAVSFVLTRGDRGVEV